MSPEKLKYLVLFLGVGGSKIGYDPKSTQFPPNPS